jgi:hypothetical protein
MMSLKGRAALVLVWMCDMFHMANCILRNGFNCRTTICVHQSVIAAKREPQTISMLQLTWVISFDTRLSHSWRNVSNMMDCKVPGSSRNFLFSFAPPSRCAIPVKCILKLCFPAAES